MVTAFSKGIQELLVCDPQDRIKLLVACCRCHDGRHEDLLHDLLLDGLIGIYSDGFALIKLFDNFVHSISVLSGNLIL